MTLYNAYKQTDHLEEVAFIAGTDFSIEFKVYDDENNPLNISSFSIKWYLSPYGQPEHPILEKDCVATGDYSFKVELSSHESISLGGTYLQQPELKSASGKIIRPGQGIVLIRKAIPSQN